MRRHGGVRVSSQAFVVMAEVKTLGHNLAGGIRDKHRQPPDDAERHKVDRAIGVESIPFHHVYSLLALWPVFDRATNGDRRSLVARGDLRSAGSETRAEHKSETRTECEQTVHGCCLTVLHENIVCSRSGPTDMMSTGAPTSSASVSTYCRVSAGKSATLRTPVISLFQPGSVR